MPGIGDHPLPGANLYITNCVHGVDLRFTPRCYLCRPEPTGSFAIGGNEGSSYLPLRELARLRKIEAAARTLLFGSGEETLPDDEWDPVFLALREALEDRT